MNLLDKVNYSQEHPLKIDLIRTAGSNIVLVCLESGQVITPHPEPYAVVFVVLEGEGAITAGAREYSVQPLHMVPVGKDEDRGIRCDRRMTLLGIREDTGGSHVPGSSSRASAG